MGVANGDGSLVCANIRNCPTIQKKKIIFNAEVKQGFSGSREGRKTALLCNQMINTLEIR